LLVINHLWRGLIGPDRFTGPCAARMGWAMTFMAVVLAWVLFRADNAVTAWAIYQGMFGLNGFVLPEQVANILPFASGWVQTVGKMQTLGGGSVMGVFEQGVLISAGLAIALFGQQAAKMSNLARLLVIGGASGFIIHALFFAAPKQFMYFQF
jgi:hypothetical protein